MISDTALFLDFDGVICDSFIECFSSSWYAYYILYLKSSQNSMRIEDNLQFRKIRPMVRNSEDNVVIQYIIRSKAAVTEQKDFDQICGTLGTETLTDFRNCFYEARDFFLADYRNFWLNLNVIFPPLLGPLRKIAENPGVYVLSTKKPSFIDEIVKYNFVEWPFERILEARGRSKEDIINDVIDSAGYSKAVFIDDQIDHLRFRKESRISCYLAEWGYVSEEGLKDFSVPHMSLKEAAAFLMNWSA